MKMMKLSSIFLLSLFFISAFVPEASARHGCRSSFGLSFNVGGPGYVVAPAPVVAAPVYQAPVYPAPVYQAPVYPTYVQAPAYYYSAPAPVVVQRPGYYVQPGFSYTYRSRR